MQLAFALYKESSDLASFQRPRQVCDSTLPPLTPDEQDGLYFVAIFDKEVAVS